MLINPSTTLSFLIKAFKRFFWIGMAAFMLGVSNVILEEDRSINDTRSRIEQQVVQSSEEE